MRLSIAFTALALLLVLPGPLAAQTFVVGQEINGQINVQVNATLGDGGNDYHPLTGLALTLYRGVTDSLQLRTDDTGVLAFAIAPGTYRLTTSAPYPFRGRSYRWDLPLVVKRNMGIVNLTAANAVVVDPAATGKSRTD